MHIHILGICGTFMGGIAIIARQLGFKVTGSDANVYPPMSTQLEEQGITLTQGYDPAQLDPAPDLVVIGNAMARGNPAVEYVLERGLRYTSGPAFLAQHVLPGRWVLGVSGTHGKTTTSGMLTWLLQAAGLEPGFLVGGVPQNFGVSARIGKEPFFVVEADEYDSAFFDKRSKFIHYMSRTLIINNIEFDHGDIFDDLAAIKRQFHHLVRTVPGNGLIIWPEEDDNVRDVLDMGCWTPAAAFGGAGSPWQLEPLADDYSHFRMLKDGKSCGEVKWDLIGRHNMFNGAAALIAAQHAGVPLAGAMDSLTDFRNVRRRMEIRGVVNDITVYDDFAHHPTAIATTVEGLRKRVREQRILAVLEPRSNTMRLGAHKDSLAPSLKDADQVLMLQPADIDWRLEDILGDIPAPAQVYNDVDQIVSALVSEARPGDHILVMSNGGFGGIHDKLLKALEERA